MTIDEYEEVICRWQHHWMDVKGTDERDRSAYFKRASGIDANMRYGLAKMLVEAERDAMITGKEL